MNKITEIITNKYFQTIETIVNDYFIFINLNPMFYNAFR